MLDTMAVIPAGEFLKTHFNGIQNDINSHIAGGVDTDLMAGLMKVVEEEKPQFVIVQYGKTDDVFHAHGPFSQEAGKACAEADAWLGKLVPWLRARGYAIIITADHGQHEFTRKNGTTGGSHGSASDVDCLVPLVWLPSVDRAKEPPNPARVLEQGD